MAKLYFRYSAMNSGKSTNLIQAAYNYEERGMRVIIVKPQVDTKIENSVSSRLGISRDADLIVSDGDNIMKLVTTDALLGEKLACVLVDEVQFLTKSQIEELFTIAVTLDIPVICYGLRTDFKGQGFPGASRLLELAHSIEEMKTICVCGKKATMNGRLIDGEFVSDGDQVSIDKGDVSYQSLCGKCYLEKVSTL